MVEAKRTYPSRYAKIVAAIILVSAPVGISSWPIAILLRRDGLSQIVQLQFINCYVSILPFLTLIALIVAMFVVSSRSGASPFLAVSYHLLRFLLYSGFLGVLGLFVLKTRFLSHQFFYSTASQQVIVALTNFLLVMGAGGVYLLIFPVWKRLNINNRSKVYLLLALLLWGYLLSSIFRMLPIPYIVAVE